MCSIPILIVIDVRLDQTVELLILQIKGLREDMNTLGGTLGNFSKGVNDFRDDMHVIKDIHRELLSILRSMSFVQSEVPTLLNGIVNMATETMTLTQQVRDSVAVKVDEMDKVLKGINKSLAAMARLNIALISGEDNNG